MKTLDKYFNPVALRNAKNEARAFKSRTAFAYMKPQRFLDIAKAFDTGKPDRDREEAVAQAVFNKRPLDDIPYLRVIRSPIDVGGLTTFECVGHEGRHRSAVLSQLRNPGLMPVRIVCSTTRWEEEKIEGTIRIKKQEGSLYVPVELTKV